MSDKLPRVSEVLAILGDSYANVPAHVLETASERGTALHRLCLTYLAAQMDLCEMPVPTPPYVAAYNGFVSWTIERQIVPIAVEQGSENLRDGYRGTPDTLVQYGPKGVLTIPDIKFTAAILPINRVQVQAYWKMDLYKDARKAMLLHINHETGAWREHHVEQSPRDWSAFLSALNVWKWRQQ